MRRIGVILVAVRELRARRSVIIERAAKIASGSGARLELFHDLATPVYIESLVDSGETVASLTRQARTHAVRQLERMAEPLRRRGVKVHTAAVWDFPPYEAVVRRAMAIKADLIVVQKRGHHRLPALLGYTDWELLRASPIPVLLIKNSRHRPRAPIVAAVDPQPVGARTGALEKRLLENAAALADALKSPLHAVQVLMPETNTPPRRKAVLAALAKTARIKGTRIHLLAGDPDALLPAMARRLRAGVFVMGTMSRRGLKRLFIGNSAERLLDDLHCDVLVVKPPRYVAPLPRARRGVYFLSQLPVV
jgi:universal stress protein E